MTELKQIRDQITELDYKIIDQLQTRSKFLLNNNFYKNGNHIELDKDSSLLHYMQTTYLPIIQNLCAGGNNKLEWNKLLSIDVPLVKTIIKRTHLGIDVANYKDPRGLPIYVKEVEDKKLKEFEALYKTNPVGIKKAMQFIMDETKRIEDITINYSNSLFPTPLPKPLKIYKTGIEDLQGIIESSAKEEIKLLKDNTGKSYSLKKGREANLFTVAIYEV